MTQNINPKGDEQNYNRQLLPEVSATSAAENISIGRTSRSQKRLRAHNNLKHKTGTPNTTRSSTLNVLGNAGVYYKHFDRLTLLHFTQQVCTLH